jgi:hypothetical protein
MRGVKSATSLRGAPATKQSMLSWRGAMDCFVRACHRAARSADPVARNDERVRSDDVELNSPGAYAGKEVVRYVW